VLAGQSAMPVQESHVCSGICRQEETTSREKRESEEGSKGEGAAGDKKRKKWNTPTRDV